MLEFLAANLSSIIVGAVIVGITIWIIVSGIRGRKKGNSACASCPNAACCGHNRCEEENVSAPPVK